MTIGTSFNQRPAEQLMDWARRADEAGFDEIWLEGHRGAWLTVPG